MAIPFHRIAETYPQVDVIVIVHQPTHIVTGLL